MRRTATLLIAMCMALATAAQTAFHGREIRRRPDMGNVDMVDTVSWYANESIRLSIEPVHRGARIPIPDDATALWIVADEGGTNWIVRWASAVTPTNVLFELAAGEGALPAGHDYTGFVDLMRGTNVLGVIDRFEVACITSAYGSSPITPAAGTWEGLAGAVASNAATIAAMSTNYLPATLERRSGRDKTGSPVIIPYYDVPGDAHFDELGLDGTFIQSWNDFRAECAGGWRWPDYFTIDFVTAGASDGAFTNVFTATNNEHNVSVGIGRQSVYKGWRFATTITRQRDFEGELVFSDDSAGDPALLPLDYANGAATFPPDTDFAALDLLDEAAMHAAIDRPVTATLGTRTLTTNIVWDGDAQRSTTDWRIFISPAPGSLLAGLWNHVLATASNRAAAPWGKALRVWPSGYGSASNTQDHPAVAWNPNFFAYGLADFSSVSYWAEGANASGGAGYPSGVYRPVTMVTPRHGIVAKHWCPAVGSNVLWLGRSGTILTNRVAAYRNIRGDLSVARLASPLPTNEVAPAALLSMFSPYLCGSTNVPGFYRAGNEGTWGVPVLPFDCAERGGVAWWRPRALLYGEADASDEDTYTNTQDDSLPQRKANAVGGDSGSPTFLLVPDTDAPVLLGCYQYSTTKTDNYEWAGGPIPFAGEVNDAIAAWGDSERVAAIDFAALGYANYNTNGLPPGPGASGTVVQDEPEDEQGDTP